MYIQPQSTITFHSGIPAFDGSRRLWFPTQAAQETYFNNHIAKRDTPCQYVKHHEGLLRVSYSVANVRRCTYITFRNPNFENVLYYARILDCRYVNNETTEILYAIDKWLTYRFECTFFDCGIERESESVEDITKAAANPYDPTLIDMDTPEDLPDAPELEKRYYSVDSAVEDDTFLAFHKLWETKVGSYTWKDTWMNIIAISPFRAISQVEEAWWTNLQADLGTSQTNAALSWKQTATSLVVSRYLRDLIGMRFPTAHMRSNIPRQYNCYMFDEEMTTHTLDEIIQHAQLSEANILGVYRVPLEIVLSMFLASDDEVDYNDPVLVLARDASDLNVRHKKLCRSPYSRLDVIAPTGESKSYAFEYFVQGEGYNGHVALAPMTDYNLGITMSIAPFRYKMGNAGRGSDKIKSLTNQELKHVNMNERLSVTAFPQMPYASDSFLTALAASNSAYLRGATTYNIAEMKEQYNTNLDARNLGVIKGALNIGGSIASSAISGGEAINATDPNVRSPYGGNEWKMSNGEVASGLISSFTGVAGASMDLVNNTSHATNALKLQKQQISYYYGADQLSMSQLDKCEIYTHMLRTKRAYGYEYDPGTGDGSQMYDFAGFIDIIVKRVVLRDDILALYDKYFDAFGYATRRIGIPRVTNVNPTSDAETPTWWDVDGFKMSFIKTEGCHVSHPARDVAEYIETMFDGGVQFINGEYLS